MHTLARAPKHTQTVLTVRATVQQGLYQDSAHISALDDAELFALDAALTYRPSGANRRTNFTRVLVRKAGSKTYTTVCLDDDYFLVAMKFAYGEMSALNTALRKAALIVKEDRHGHFSHVVREKALLSLRGHYQPARAAALASAKDDAAQILSDVNNAAWTASQAEYGVRQ